MMIEFIGGLAVVPWVTGVIAILLMFIQAIMAF